MTTSLEDILVVSWIDSEATSLTGSIVGSFARSCGSSCVRPVEDFTAVEIGSMEAVLWIGSEGAAVWTVSWAGKLAGVESSVNSPKHASDG